MKSFLFFLACAGAGAATAAVALGAEEKLTPPIGQLTTPGWSYAEVRRFKAPEAGQGVAVDREFFYAINNHTIGKYRKATGERVAGWEGGAGGEVIHLNAGFVRDGRLYGIHSNFPGVPMLSSLELFDVATMRHVGSHSFGRMDGSLTWLDRAPGATGGAAGGAARIVGAAAGGAGAAATGVVGGAAGEAARGGATGAGVTVGAAGRWIACFVHYGNRGAEPNRDPAWTQIVAFDDEWRRTAGWALPAALIARFGDRGYSASGGAFGPGGYLYLTGHDNTELYVVAWPQAGSVLRWIATIPFPSEGQAFCWDEHEPGVLWSIARKTREVVVGRVTVPGSVR